MARFIYYLTNLIVISVIVYIPETSANSLTYSNAINILKDENSSMDLFDKAAVLEDVCNDTNPCQNAGTCNFGLCRCPSDYTGSRCETPLWCTKSKCGYENDVECVWNRTRREGECRCKKDNYHFLPMERKCYECHCGDHGKCQVVENTLACKCDEGYSVKKSVCEACDCGPKTARCVFNYKRDKVCHCPKGYASKTSSSSSYGSWCEVCDCGEHGRCSFEGEQKFCDCEDGYKLFGGKCVECNCGRHGICKLNESGGKICTCDYNYAENNGFCEDCDCNYLSSKRTLGANCSFAFGKKQCTCPPGYKKGKDYCEDINECFTTQPCLANTFCINKPGTYECKCNVGYRRISSSLDPNLSGCEDIDECAEFPCVSPATRCVNSPGSFDCVCKDGYYASSGTYGSSYKPAYNNCYEIETQWRDATIALGVILSVGIIGISYYIMRHKRNS